MRSKLTIIRIEIFIILVVLVAFLLDADDNAQTFFYQVYIPTGMLFGNRPGSIRYVTFSDRITDIHLFYFVFTWIINNFA